MWVNLKQNIDQRKNMVFFEPKYYKYFTLNNIFFRGGATY